MRLRLLKMVVQPVFVADDGEFLTEQIVDAITIPASGWQEFVTTGLAESTARLQESLMEGVPVAEKRDANA